MTITAYNAMVANLVQLCGGSRRCVTCCDIITFSLISGYLTADERAQIAALPLLRTVFDSRETNMHQHVPLRSLLDELGRALLPVIAFP